MNSIADHLKRPLANLLLALADDKLFLGHRSSDWTGLGPILEEDIAFSHLAQDEMAHAQALYEFVGALVGRTADDLAFGRRPNEYLCAHIVEVPDEFDWATALARKFFCDHFDLLRLGALSRSVHKPLADLARRMAAEEKLHVDHVDGWMVRLGRGTAESRQRVQRGLDALAPIAPSLLEPVEGQQQLERSGVYPVNSNELRDAWLQALSRATAAAGLDLHVPSAPAGSTGKPAPGPLGQDGGGGRHGVHTPAFSEMLDEMCEVYRIEPGAAW